MNLHPFWEVAENAERKMRGGWDVYQQFQCQQCKTKQTMEEKNSFHLLGLCEECGHETNIEKDGCNFMAVIAAKPGEVKDRVQEIVGG